MKRNLVFVLTLMMVLSRPVFAADAVRDIAFPVQGGGTYIDDYNDGSGTGRIHHGTDIHAPKMTPVLAANAGEVIWLTETEPPYGWMLKLRDAEGYEYHYIHINNDTPGTDDGMGGYNNAFAPGIQRGSIVTRGQHIAYVGDSGNAEGIDAHLHFEIRLPSGAAMNPYQSLRAAEIPGRYSPSDERNASPDINTDRGLVATPGTQTFCLSGSLIRSATSTAVYYCGADGKRYVFPNDKAYFTWYADFKTVLKITDAEMGQIPIGGNVTYRPGVKLVKIQSDPKVYAVAHGGTLRWVSNPDIAKKLYGISWAKQVDDVEVTFFINYKTGDPVTAAD